MFNTFLHLEALFSKPKTVQNRQQNHVRLVETLSYARRTLTSAQNAPKMRQDGPDERFGSFLTAKTTPQNAPKSKKTPPKKQSKNSVQKPCWKIIASRRTGKKLRGDAVAPRIPYPFSSGQPRQNTAHIFEIPSLLFGGKPPSFPAKKQNTYSEHKKK